MTAVTLCLCRHGQTAYNAADRVQGQLDEPLDATGVAQAHEVAAMLAGANLQAILTSDLTRALDTARIVATALALPLHPDPRLRESHMGEAQGLHRDAVLERFGAELSARWHSRRPEDMDIAYPGGETGRAVLERSVAAIQAFVTAHPAVTRCLVVSHGGVMRRLLAAAEPPDFDSRRLGNGELVWLGYEPPGRFIRS